MSLTLVAGGWASNLLVYLITEYNIKSIAATKIFNIAFGCNFLFPIAAAIISDSFSGSFPVVSIFAFVSLLVTSVSLKKKELLSSQFTKLVKGYKFGGIVLESHFITLCVYFLKELVLSSQLTKLRGMLEI